MRNRARKQHPSAFGAAGASGVVRGVRTRERKHMRHRWQWIALAVFLAIAALAGYAAWVYFGLQGHITKDFPSVTQEEEEGRPFNALLVGSDSRSGLTEREQLDLGAEDEGVEGERADTLILAHVDPATDHVTMVQFPRDLWVPMAGGGKDRINLALQAGRKHLVMTVERLTGLEVNRYLQVNIAGFRDLIDAIDGVDVCVPERIPFDPQTGIRVKNPGMVHFNGDKALRFVRSRKVFAKIGRAHV
jgi:LCP family protein required for cell wall assembly